MQGVDTPLLYHLHRVWVVGIFVLLEVALAAYILLYLLAHVVEVADVELAIYIFGYGYGVCLDVLETYLVEVSLGDKTLLLLVAVVESLVGLQHLQLVALAVEVLQRG